ncbi:MAG: glycerol-3-phosphate 1-O-acyltransferase PlsY [Armatimonadetes bacterium]|nr:glycerol-3-phosphate 1-O-acyltransferase PlsY [Armatimonadota bacterium]
MKALVILVASYFLGSVPFGLIICKLWKGIDIRTYGSGNIGATNVMRSAGKGPAIVVFLADVLKGLVVVLAAKHFVPTLDWLPVIAGMLAIVGHSASVFLRFSGGKGVATSLGVVIGLDWRVAAIGFGLWVVTVVATRYVSVASILASASVPVFMFVFQQHISYKLFALLAASFVIVRHHSNIKRLTQGKEPKWGDKVRILEDRNDKGR